MQPSHTSPLVPDTAREQVSGPDPLQSTHVALSPDAGGFRHILQLDGIRGIAIALIVCYHFLSGNDQTQSRLIAMFIAFRSSLWIGVDLFFVLSGFLITGILFDTVRSPHFLRNFYGRRVVRIFPLYFLALGMIGLITLAYGVSWQGQGWKLFLYLNNTPLWLNAKIPLHLLEPSDHLWSLALEEQFYLIWPFLVLMVKDRRRLMHLALGLSLAAILVRTAFVLHGNMGQYTYKMLPCRMDALLIGGWVALAMRGPERQLIMERSRQIFLPIAMVVLIYGCFAHGILWETDPVVNTIGYSVIAVAFGALIALSLRPSGWITAFFLQPWLRWLGKYSYGIYVWHMIFGPYVERAVRRYAVSASLPAAIALLLGAMLAAAVSLAIGVISYHAFEVHFLRLKRYFAYAKS